MKADIWNSDLPIKHWRIYFNASPTLVGFFVCGMMGRFGEG
jgi:hypothetical protein